MAKGTSRRAWWVVGIVLLVGSAVGAGRLFQHASAGAQEGAPPSPGLTDPAGPLGIIAQGYVDVKDGVRRLFPLQTGLVVWVAPEGKACEKDEVLLQLDDQLAKFDAARAKAALQEVQAKYKQAKKLPKQHELEVEAQKKAIKFAESQVRLAQQNQKLRKAYKSFNVAPITKSEIDAGEALVLKAQANVELEQAKLNKLKEIDPAHEIERSLADANAKKALLDKAEKAVGQLYQVRAPAKGTVLRVQTAAGELAGPQSSLVPVQFCPEEERIVRAEVLQDWAAKVKVGQECDIQDDAISGKRWKGKVTHVSPWYTQRRSIIQEPFQLNDVRTLECLVSLDGGAEELRIGQRLRVTIKQGGP